MAVFIVQFAVCTAYGYYSSFAQFSSFDDEGFLLIGTKLFMAGRALYDDVFTIFGPLSYLVKWAVHAPLGWPVSNDSLRLFGLAYWLLAAGFCALAVGRLCRSIAASLMAFVTIFHMLHLIIFCPGHPRDLCAALLGLAVAVATLGGCRRGAALTASGLGAIGGLLVTTRINVGVFLLMALGATLLVLGPRTRSVRALCLLYLMMLLGAPVVLLVPLLSQTWCAQLLWIELSGIVAVWLMVFAQERVAVFAPRHIVQAVACFLLVLVMVCGLTWLHGTSGRGAIVGTFMMGPRFARTVSYFQQPVFSPLAWFIPLVALMTALTVIMLPRTGRRGMRAASQISAAARIALGLFLAGTALRAGPQADYMPLVACGPCFAFLLLAPPFAQNQTQGEVVARVFLAFLSVTELLWVYPVAGDQKAFATFLSVAASIVYLKDGVDVLLSSLSRANPLVRDELVPLARSMLVLTLLLFGTAQALGSQGQYESQTPLNLPGAGRLRLPAQIATQLKATSDALRARADTFLTLPGLNSFYAWSGHDPPTGLNASNWMFLLDDDQQERIIASVRDRPGVAVLVQMTILQFWVYHSGDSAIERSPLVRYINSEFEPTKQFGGYYLWERKKPRQGRRTQENAARPTLAERALRPGSGPDLR